TDECASLRTFNLDAPAERIILTAELNCFGSVLYDEPEIVELERLRQVVVGAGFNGFDGHSLRAMRGDDDHERAVAVSGFDFAEKIEAAHSREVDIEQEKIGLVLFQQCPGGFGRTSFRDVVTKSREGAPHAVAGSFLVVNYHQSQRFFSHFQSSLGPSGPKLL